MSTASDKDAEKDESRGYAYALYEFLQQEWAALGVRPTPWCREAGIADPTVYRWKTGVEPDMRSLRRVARALDRPLLDVLVAAGYLDPAEVGGYTAPPREYSVLDALRLDTTLPVHQREALLTVYKAMADGHAPLHDLVHERLHPVPDGHREGRPTRR